VQPLLPWRSNNYYIFFVFVVALVIQHALRICHILSSVGCPASFLILTRVDRDLIKMYNLFM